MYGKGFRSFIILIEKKERKESVKIASEALDIL